MKVYPYAVLGLAVTWMFLRGSLTLVTFLEGLFFGLVTVFITRTILKPEWRETFPRVLRRLPAFLRYLGFFVIQVIQGNVDVAYRTLHPRLPISPGILAVDIAGRSDLEVAMLANTITLTPGTLTLDVDRKRGLLFVHTINIRDMDVVRAEIQQVGRAVERVMR